MADAIMEQSLSAAIESNMAAHAATAIWLVPPPPTSPPPYQQQHRFEQQELPLLVPSITDGGGGDAVADMLDEFRPRDESDSDLDEQMLQRPMAQQVLLLAMATLRRQAELDMQTVLGLIQGEGEAPYLYADRGGVPAHAAAVAALERQTFHAGGREDDGAGGITCAACSICLEEFEDGEEMAVMPCSGRHEFHPECIVEWLGQYSNTCPLCRHALPMQAQ